MENATREKIIEIKNLKKDFGSTNVLKDISLDVYKGDVIAIIGPSGSGKSTFLRCINLLEQPTDGEVIYRGVRIDDSAYFQIKRLRSLTKKKISELINKYKIEVKKADSISKKAMKTFTKNKYWNTSQ
jgi:ABC-type histidine transport system ATPase subunit